jgi:hypothetical protein
MLSKEHTKILKKLNHTEYFPYDNGKFTKQLDYLMKLGHVNLLSDSDKYGDSYNLRYQISEKGKAYLHDSKINNRHWYIPVLISAIALIKSFDKEIICIVEQLLKLLEQ